MKTITATRKARTMTTTSAEIIYHLAEASALGKLTITGDGVVTITGPQQDRYRARTVLTGQGLRCTVLDGHDEWDRPDGDTQ